MSSMAKLTFFAILICIYLSKQLANIGLDYNLAPIQIIMWTHGMIHH